MSFTREGLLFREVESYDLESLRAWRNNPEMAAGWRNPLSVQTEALQQAWYESLNAANQAFLVHFGDGINLADVDVPSLPTIGLLRFTLDYQMNEARITGTDIAPDYQGKGYGKRLLKGASDYVQHTLGFHRVTAEGIDSNPGIHKVILSAGYELEGRLKQYVWRDGEWHDWLLYARIRRTG